MLKYNDIKGSPYIRYTLPLLVFLALGSLQAAVDSNEGLWIAYGIKIALTGALLGRLFIGRWSEIEGRFDWKAVAVGLLVLVVWVWHYHLFSPHDRPLFNPTRLQDSTAAMLAITVRLIGAVLVVPILEELVFRSFLMRFLIKNEFLTVPLGTFTIASFWGTVLAFMVVHAQWQWPVAAFAGVAYGYYVVRTKNLWGAIIAHAVTNLGLGIYAIMYGEWGLWG